MNTDHFSINLSSQNFKDLSQGFFVALKGLHTSAKEHNLLDERNVAIFQAVTTCYDELTRTGKCDFDVFIELIDDLIWLNRKADVFSRFRYHLLSLPDYIVRARDNYRQERSKAMRGLICVNLRTGLVYISK
jgi:hypothetical protein